MKEYYDAHEEILSKIGHREELFNQMIEFEASLKSNLIMHARMNVQVGQHFIFNLTFNSPFTNNFQHVPNLFSSPEPKAHKVSL